MSMLIVYRLSKAIEHVRSHLRQGHPVRAYPRRGKEAARRLFEQHYHLIDRWALSAVRHLQRSGSGLVAGDDAYAAAMEAAFLSIRTYDPRRGRLENLVRHAITLALSKFVRAERSRGLTGVDTLYSQMRTASSQRERDSIAEKFPRVEAIGSYEIPGPSTEELLEGNRELIKREDFISALEPDLASKLRQLKDYIATQERKKKTWRKKQLARRRLKVFELRMLGGQSFREIANGLGIDVSDAYSDFKQVTELIREAREAGIFMKKSKATKDLRHWRLIRLMLCLERLQVAIREGFPPGHIEFIRSVLAELIAELTDEEETQN